MLFGLEYDQGHSVGGYLVPDGHSETAAIAVLDGEEFLCVVPCTGVRDALKAIGRHETGIVEFLIDESIVNDLRFRQNLILRDAKNGILIYRRLPYLPPVSLKVMRLETHIIPALALDRQVANNFHYYQNGLDRFGHESIQQAFHSGIVSSVYLSGRIMLRNYEEFFDKGYLFAGFFYDPYYEMATRIYVFNRMHEVKSSAISARERMLFGPAVSYFSGINLAAHNDLQRLFRKMPPRVQTTLRSPYVRQLACSRPEEMPDRRSIASAMDILSRFHAVGHAADIISYLKAFGRITGADPDLLKAPSLHSPIEALARELRNTPAAERLLEEDLIFDHYLRKAACLSTLGDEKQTMKK